MFPAIERDKSFPQREVDVLQFWKERQIYHKTLAARAGAPPFVFYEGPPTANGMPHPGHCLTRAIKDLFPRYKTMRGFFCERKAGWDTHGLPVETEVSKELGIHSKGEIEQYGVEPFIHRCQQSVWRYMNEWERMTERLGFWVDLENAYVTYHQSYVESVWWSLKELFDRGLLYKGHKIVWWWPQGGTALSAGEVSQGYREVADPSVYVKFPIIGGGQAHELKIPDNTSLLVWTTTPWTLPGNQFVAVHPEIEYSLVEVEGMDDSLIVASDLVESVIPKATIATPQPIVKSTLASLNPSPRPPAAAPIQPKYHVVAAVRGSDLAGLRYQPPFIGYISDHLLQRMKAMPAPPGVDAEELADERMGQLYLDPVCPWLFEFKVVTADFVTTDSGTGLVHVAPAFGEVDYNLLVEQQAAARRAAEGPEPALMPQLLNPVAPDGRYTEEGPDYCFGRWMKDCDKDIIADLKQRNLLYHREQYVHDYPFCWRAEEDPLIQYPRESWFVRTTAFKEAMLENNSHINWLPEHIKEGRFGKFLESNVDWALSRERFWGTPLPIWVCSKTGTMEAVASYDELLAKPGVRGAENWSLTKKAHPELPEDLQVHKPYIDYVEYDSPYAKGGVMQRVSEVIDCWYDSGAMPFAQWGFRGEKGPAEAAERFKSQFPSDFISEAIDQTRGWFYSQLAISTMLWGKSDEAQMTSDEKEASPHSSFVIRPSSFPSFAYPHPFKTCIVLGLMLGEDGQKMSKSKRNYREPQEIFDRYGADALRWYFFANQPPWTSIRYSEQAIKDSIPEFLLRLWNVYSFFTIYANIDAFDPWREIASPPVAELSTTEDGPPDVSQVQGDTPEERDESEETAQTAALPNATRKEEKAGLAIVAGEALEQGEPSTSAASLPNPPHQGEGTERLDIKVSPQLVPDDFAKAPSYRPRSERAELDRWILSELHRTAAAVVERMDQYDNFAACGQITEFVDALSNWYVRRSRLRFWSADKRAADKLDAYWTLYECLITTAKLIAPFTPFLAENLWRNLAATPFGEQAFESVHLCDYPEGEAVAIDEQLSERMNLVRHIASLGRQARTAAGLKVRQPLARVEVILADATHQPWLEEHAAVIAEELNVKKVEFSDQPEKYVDYEVLPDFKRLGPKLGKLMPKVKPALAKQSGAALLKQLRDKGHVELAVDEEKVTLTQEDVEIRLQAKPGWAAANEKNVVVVLATELTPELVAEGLARDLVRVIQDRRKELGCEFTDRINVGIVAKSQELQAAVQSFGDYIAAETLAEKIVAEPLSRVERLVAKVGEADVELYVQVAS